ncbi:hypothetical protein HDU96_008627 [Phlyctochytrium bullatum]|nr:hypothetical protein HDU96_008627 [Phlyctochytrium bullatum]
MQENIKGVIANLVQNYRDLIDNIEYVQTFKNLILRFEQNAEAPAVSTATDAAAVEQKPDQDGWGRVDRTEDAYFEKDDDDEVDELEEKPRSSSDRERALARSRAVLSGEPVAIPTSPVVNAKPAPISESSSQPLVNYPDEDDSGEEPTNANGPEMHDTSNPSPSQLGGKRERAEDETSLETALDTNASAAAESNGTKPGSPKRQKVETE